MPNEPASCGGTPKPTGENPTPNGSWHCDGNATTGEWVWIPEIGK